MNLNMPPEQFGRLTFAHFDRLVHAWRDEQRRRDWRAGVLYAVTANAYRGKGARAARPEDVFPTLRRERRPKVGRMAADEIIAHLKPVWGGKSANG